jgi:RNA-directed DNA polymerase
MISDCIQRKIRYTRYADDLSFSGDFDEKNSSSSKESLKKFKINTAKTKLMTPGNRQTVTGIVVNENRKSCFTNVMN